MRIWGKFAEWIPPLPLKYVIGLNSETYTHLYLYLSIGADQATIK